MQDKTIMESSRQGYYLIGVIPLIYVVFSVAMIVKHLLALQMGVLKLGFFLGFQLAFATLLTVVVFFFCLRSGHLKVAEEAAYFKNIFTAAYQTIPYENIQSMDFFINLFGYKIAYQLTLKNTPRWRRKLIFFSFKHRPGGVKPPVVDPIFDYLIKKIKK